MSGTNRFWNNTKVLVTGHEGFLGSWLTKALVEGGARVTGIDKVTNRKGSVLDDVRQKVTGIKGDIAQEKLMRTVIEKYKPQYIFHLAAEAIVDEALKSPVRALRSNIQGTWNLLEAVRGQDGIEGIVVASSDKAYGEHEQLPYHEHFPLQGQHPYDASKSCADLLCQMYWNTYNVPVCVTRCGNIYGPGDYHYTRIVPDGIRSVLKGRQLDIRSNGQFTRDYIYVEDIVRAYLTLAQKMKKLKLPGQAFNFSAERPISVLKLYQKILNLAGRRDLKPRILNRAKYEIPHQYLSAEKARSVLKWKADHTLEEGLNKTIEWYKTHG